MTETEKVNAYELSEYGRELLWRTAYRVTYQRMELAWYEGVLHSTVKRLSASSQKSTSDCYGNQPQRSSAEFIGRQINEKILDCARRGWINTDDIREIERVGFDL